MHAHDHPAPLLHPQLPQPQAPGLLTPAETERAIVQQQQVHLLLLRHASVCHPESDGHCPAGFPRCAEFKALWAHIAGCRAQHGCPYPQCMSSRACMSHYSKCKHVHCQVCGPVRLTIRSGTKAYEDQLNELGQRVVAHILAYPVSRPPPFPDCANAAGPHALHALAAAAAVEAEAANMNAPNVNAPNGNAPAPQ